MVTVVNGILTAPDKKCRAPYFSAKCGSGHSLPKFEADLPALHA
jgi:hypothetical protein